MRHDPWAPGQLLLGDFCIERQLGAGGMGAVYLVESRSTGERFAVKKAHLSDRASTASFLTELQTWIDLPEHPHLAACRFFRTIDDEIVIFADFIDQGSLADWIAQARLASLAERLDVAIQTAWGLHAAHELGLVHQDVKPGNVLLTAERVAKVSDFGLARARAVAGEHPGEPMKTTVVESPQNTLPATRSPSSSSSGELGVLVSCGGMTPAYRSPEQAAGRRLSRHTDIWSWGLTVLEMFIGEVTWMDGQAAPDILYDFVAGGSDDPKSLALPATVADVLGRCFRLEPLDRWPTLENAADELRHIYRQLVGWEYPRLPPASARRQVFVDTMSGREPRWFLVQALQAAGRDPRLADALPSHSAGSSRAQAVADIAILAEARGILEPLVAGGRDDLVAVLAYLYHRKAGAHEIAKDLPGALELRRQAVELLEPAVLQHHQADLASLLAEAYTNLGYAHWLRKNYQASLDAYDRAENLFEEMVSGAESEQEAERLARELAYNLALLHSNKAAARSGLGDRRAALALYDQAKSILNQLISEEPERAELLDRLAGAHMGEAECLEMLGRYHHAGYAYDDAIKLRERLVNELGHREFTEALSRAYVNKAIMFGKLQQPGEAVALYDKAIALRQRLVNEQGRRDMLDALARAIGYKAEMLTDLGQHDAARESFDRAIALWEQLVYREGQAEQAHDLAMAYLAKGTFYCEVKDYSAAAVEDDRAIAMLERIFEQGHLEAAPDLAGAIMNKCHALKMLGDHAGALALFDRVIPSWERLVGQGRRELAPELAKALGNKARVTESAGDPAAALKLCDQAVELYIELIERDGWNELEGELAGAMVDRAGVRDKLGDRLTAVAELDHAIEMLKRVNERRDSPKLRSRLENAQSLRECLYMLARLDRSDQGGQPAGPS